MQVVTSTQYSWSTVTSPRTTTIISELFLGNKLLARSLLKIILYYLSRG